MKKLLFIITILIVTTITATTITIGNFNKQVADKERYKWDCVYWAIAMACLPLTVGIYVRLRLKTRTYQFK